MYSRFELPRPQYLSDEYWDSIQVEAERLARSLQADDDVQVLGDAKCLVEAVAKVTLEINGTPAGPRDGLQKLVSGAHETLRTQPGPELTHENPYGMVALQASKMAANLAEIRNTHGGGHGRARQPNLRDEMVDLALDGAFTWTRWVLRRLGLFAEGRPTQLIEALIVDRAIFSGGELRRRLQAANLSQLEEHHQRAVGVAVGQRSATGTFVVTGDGVSPAMSSTDLDEWPEQYRIGLAYGVLFDPAEQPTVRPNTLLRAVEVLVPVTDTVDEITELVDRIIENYDPNTEADTAALTDVAKRTIALEGEFAAEMRPQMARLGAHLLSGVL